MDKIPTSEEADAILRDAGLDPIEVGRRGAEFVRRLKDQARLARERNEITEAIAGRMLDGDTHPDDLLWLLVEVRRLRMQAVDDAIVIGAAESERDELRAEVERLRAKCRELNRRAQKEYSRGRAESESERRRAEGEAQGWKYTAESISRRVTEALGVADRLRRRVARSVCVMPWDRMHAIDGAPELGRAIDALHPGDLGEGHDDG